MGRENGQAGKDSRDASGAEATSDFLAGDGEMAAHFRAHDWSASPLGDPSTWPQSLRSVVQLMLANRHLMFVAWGPQLTFLYNDGYAPVLGQKHPWALGRPFKDVWPEIWDDIEPLVNAALAGEATWSENLHLVMERHGYPEDCWYTFSYSPVRDESGAVAGIFCAGTETTERVLAERELRDSETRLQFLRELEDALLASNDASAAMVAAAKRLGLHLGASRCAYADVDADNDRFIIRDDYSQPGLESSAGTYSLDLFGPRAAADMRSGQTLVIRDMASELAPGEGREMFQSIGINAIICCPLVKAGKLVAMMAVHQAETRNWSDEDVETIEAVVERCWAHVQRVGAEARLRESEERFHRIADSAPSPMWVTQLDRKREFVNRAYVEFLGISYGEAVDFDWREILHPADHDRIVAESIAGEASLQPFVLEARYQRKDGKWHWMRSISQPKFDANGELTGFIGVAHDVTALKEADAALRQSAAEFEALAENVSQLAWMAEPDGSIFWYNRRWYVYTGTDLQSMKDWGWRDVHHPDHVDGIIKEVKGKWAAGEPWEGTYLIRSAEGEYRWFLTRVESIRNDAGELVRWFGTNTDIHAQIEAEQALRESEVRLRMVQAAGGVGSFDYDLQKDEAICSPEYYALFGMPEGSPINRETWPASIHPDDRVKAMQALDRAIAERKPFDYEYRIVRADNGETRWLAGRATVIFDAEDRPWRYVGANIDITERKHSEAALREAGEQAAKEAAERSAILGQLAEGVIVTDAEGRIIFVNEAAVKLHGVVALDVEPSEYSETYHLFRENGTAYPFEELPLTRAVMKGETVTDARWRIRRPDGTEVIAMGSAQPIRSNEGAQFGSVLTVRNDTHRHAAEQALRELAETLEQRVAERTNELVQAQEALRQSQKLEAMGQLTGGVAHDFNNLLSPIIGGLDMLQRRGIGDERARRQIDNALQSAERAKTLVQRLLAFARRQPLQPTAVDIGSLASGMADLIGSTLGPAIEVRLDLPDETPPARADANQVEMALLNLAVNARDAMPEGGELVLHVSHECVADEDKPELAAGEYVRLCVSDNGIGMDEETRERAIEPFFSTKGVGQGTGLGLSMVHGLAAQLDGGVEIDSAPGDGTTVTLWLPVSRDALQTEKPRSEATAASERPGTVLLVDDEMLVRMGTADMLDELGYEVVEANSAEDALRLVKEGLEPDLLVTDHLMPGMNGADLAREILRQWPKLPVLLISGYAEVEGIDPSIARLTKPFRESELAERLAALMPG